MPTFKPWKNPALIARPFQLLSEFVCALNGSTFTDKESKDFDLFLFRAFSAANMKNWLAVAKSYYPFYEQDEEEKVLIEELEKTLFINIKDYPSLPELIAAITLDKIPPVNDQETHGPLLSSITLAMVKLTSVALTTPVLVEDAYRRDQQLITSKGERLAGFSPAIASCNTVIERSLHVIMDAENVNIDVYKAANALLAKAQDIKRHVESYYTDDCLENLKGELKGLQAEHRNLQMKNERLLQFLMKNSEGAGEIQSGEFEEEIKTFVWESQKEQQAIVRIAQLQKKVDEYHKYLQGVCIKSRNDVRATTKLRNLTAMKNGLEKNALLPSERLAIFQNQLDAAQEELENHRDPLWQRFLRDCLRIITLALSGVAIYRKLADKPVNFFKPSQGQQFVEESSQIINAP